jgi:hypothetical protein
MMLGGISDGRLSGMPLKERGICSDGQNMDGLSSDLYCRALSIFRNRGGKLMLFNLGRASTQCIGCV